MKKKKKIRICLTGKLSVELHTVQRLAGVFRPKPQFNFCLKLKKGCIQKQKRQVTQLVTRNILEELNLTLI